MIGTLDSDLMRIFLTTVLTLTAGFNASSADEVQLNDGISTLKGDLVAIQPTGTMELKTPMSDAPLLIKSNTVKKVTLSNPDETESMPHTILKLSNGDLLRGTIESLNNDTLVLRTDEAGTLNIDRSSVASAEFGVRRSELLFSGPSNLSEWKQTNSTRDRWQYRRGTLVSMGRASAYKDINLPQQFTLSFVLEWKSERPPQYEIFFADSVGDSKKLPDRYSFTFNNYGIEIRRYLGQKQKSETIAQMNRSPRLYPNNQMKVDLHVNRETSRIQLFINDEPEGDFVDPFEKTPNGTGIRLVSESLRGSQLEISNITVTDYNETKSRHSTEGSAKEADSMIMSDDERWSGKLIKIDEVDGESIFHFKSPSREDVLEVPGSEVSMIYFSPVALEGEPTQPEPAPTDAPAYNIFMANQWNIKAISCDMNDKTLTAKHPLLGTLNILRDRVIRIDHLKKPEPTKTK